MRGFGRNRALTCREVVELVTDYMEGALSAKQSARFEQHLAFCDPCIEYLGQIRTTVALVQQLAPAPVDQEIKDKLLELYRTWQQPPP